MKIKFDGKIYIVEKIEHYGHLPILEFEDGTEWYIAENREQAGEKAREYWEELAQNDPKEFACLVGEEVLVNWGLGISDGPGSTAVCGLQDWLDLWLDTPEEHFAGYDGLEIDVEVLSRDLCEELGFSFDPADCTAVIYRWN